MSEIDKFNRNVG